MDWAWAARGWWSAKTERTNSTATPLNTLRNSSLDAKNFFLPSQPIPLFQKNRFGAAFGGPIKKDKTDFSGRISQATRYLESFPSKRLLSIPIVPI